tara:strand:+ start:49 stop:1149 length:1101 start_codon:yes stop_codon:yes gene_type:complete
VKVKLIFLLSVVCALSDALAMEITLTDSVKKYKFLAKTARQQKDFQEAIRLYRKVTFFDSKDQKAWFFLGECLYRSKAFVEAKTAFVSALNIDSLHVNSNLRLYSIVSNESDFESAAVALERVLKAKPQSVEYRRKLADLYRRQGESKKSIFHYETILNHENSDKELIEMLAILNQDLGQTEEALKWRQILLDGGDLNSQIEQLEGVTELQLESGNYIEVFNSLYRLAVLDTINSYSYYNRAAKLAEKIDDEVNLIKSQEGMVRTNATDIETVIRLAEGYMKQNQFKLADKWIDRGLGVDANSAQLLLLKGDLLRDSGSDTVAVSFYQRAMHDPAWESIAQQRIWNVIPPETEEEKLKKAFFGGSD